MNVNNIKCSVVILTYNSELKKVLTTIKSVLLQNNCHELEIIIADDGSRNTHFEEIESFLDAHMFTIYKLISQKENRGTVANFYSAVQEAKGKYVKGIGAGDLLYSPNTIDEFCMYMDKHNSKIAFGLLRAFFYNKQNGLKYKDFIAPGNIKAFTNDSYDKICESVIVWAQHISGASMFIEKEYFESLLDEMVGKVRFCEDYLQILVLLSEERIDFLNKYCCLYEYGTGISTSGHAIWTKRVHDDYVNLFAYLEKKYKANSYVRRRVKTLRLDKYKKMHRGFLKALLEPGLFLVKLKTKVQILQKLYVGTNSQEMFDMEEIERSCTL